MKKLTLNLWLILMLCSCASAKDLSDRPIEVVYIIGQSNADGRAPSSSLKPGWDKGLENTMFFHGNGGGGAVEDCPANQWIKLKPVSGSISKKRHLFGIEIGLAQELQRCFPERRFAFIKHTRGGTNLAKQWNVNGGSLLQGFYKTRDTALKELQKQQLKYHIAGAVWQQGESDCKKGFADTYEKNLRALISELREKDTSLPFIIGRLSSKQKLNDTGFKMVRSAQDKVTSDTLFCRRFNCDDLPLQGDRLHFNAEAMLKLGQRHAQALLPFLCDSFPLRKMTVALPEPKAKRRGGVTRLSDIQSATLTTFLPPADKRSKKPMPAVLICPGGGYNILAWDLEGQDIARFLANHGIAAFVLRYRLQGKRPARMAEALADAQLALITLRKDAKKWNIDAQKIGMWGFSAGGHLSLRTSTVGDKPEAYARPDFTILSYCAYVGNKDGKLKPEFQGKLFSKALFIVHAKNDPFPWKHLQTLAKKIESEQAIAVKSHFIEKAGHGFGLTKRGSDYGNWEQHLLKFISAL